MREILVLTTTLSLGGITSYVINFVNELSKNYKVTLAYTKDDASKLSDISSDVECVAFACPSMKKSLSIMFKHGWIHHALKIKLRRHNKVSPMSSIQRVAYAQAEGTDLPDQLLKHYDVVISSAEFYCNDVVALKINANKKIAWIHPDYKALKTDVAFDRKTLDNFDFIVTVSQSTKKSLLDVIPDYSNKVVYIPNLLDAKKIRDISINCPDEYTIHKGKKIIVTVCRIDNSSKRLDRIIMIAKRLVNEREHFHWFIVGGGTDFDYISNLIKINNLSDYVSMIGPKQNPYPYIRYADMFVLTSQYEGRPIVIDEALILACPVMVTEYASSKEQIDLMSGCVISNNDDRIVDDFIKHLNWKNNDMKRAYLLENSYEKRLNLDYCEGIHNMLGD